VSDSVVVRNCEGMDDLRACLELQREVWGFSDTDLVPLRLFVVAQKIGGQALGAFEGSRMLGFALAFPGMRSGRTYLHSHMLAVRPQWRNSGVGKKIKLFQREDAISLGFDLIEWTFDPLEIKNAYFNLAGLGAIARQYNPNQYGFTSSPLQGGLPTDRLVAEWWLRSPRVETILLKGMMPGFKVEETVQVPGEIYEWKASAAAADRNKALEVQTHNRERLTSAFSLGLAALGYRRDEQGNGTFLLGMPQEARDTGV